MLTIAQIKALRGKVDKITWHWTAGTYTAKYGDYHWCIPYDKRTDSAAAYQMLSVLKKGAHVWMRNTGNIGISLCGMFDDPKTKEFDYPIDDDQIEVMAKLTAELMYLLEIPMENVQDHAYYAKKDKYYPTRWDIGNLEPIVRKKTAWYLSKLKSGETKLEHTKAMF